MRTGEILTLLRARGFRFTHSLGQNFLADEDALSRIVDAAAVDGRCVLEIGAGAGCLTAPLCRRAKRVLAVEIDDKLLPVLETVLHGEKNVRLVHGDALKIDLSALTSEAFDGEDFDVVANLPYSITTPVLFRLLDGALPVRRLCVMLQKEAVDRVAAAPGGREYGPLAVFTAYRAEMERLFRLPPDCFVPQPHVESEVIALDLRPPQPEERELLRLVKDCFRMRRKTLVNNLQQRGLTREEALHAVEKAGLTKLTRAETLGLADFQRLLEILSQ